MTISLIKKCYITMDENLSRKQKDLGILPNVNDEDEESRFRLLKESMLKFLRISESEKNESTDDDHALNVVSSENGARKKPAEKPKLVENQRTSSGEKGPLKHDKEHTANTQLKDIMKKTRKLTVPLNSSSSAKSGEHVKRRHSSNNGKRRTHDRILKHRTRRMNRKSFLCQEVHGDVETMVSKMASREDDFPVSHLSTEIPSPDLRRPSSPWQRNCSRNIQSTRKTQVRRNKKRRATPVESVETNKTCVEISVPGKTDRVESVRRFHDKKTKPEDLVKISKDFRKFSQDSQISSGNSSLSPSSKWSLRNNQLGCYTSSCDHQGERSWKRIQQRSSTSGHCLSTKVQGNREFRE
ncbi:uncharacterized protein LOC143243073 [Tachypleus tridentatus]|uniref:uncharacterized protein LOC143243073 n=1 Tax=Tachypleus tridentatus TaxID=6853 RepID=UPI003FCFF59B